MAVFVGKINTTTFAIESHATSFAVIERENREEIGVKAPLIHRETQHEFTLGFLADNQ